MGMLRPAAAVVLYSAWVPYRLVQAVACRPARPSSRPSLMFDNRSLRESQKYKTESSSLFAQHSLYAALSPPALGYYR
jgi:hypothetical protein